MNHFIDEDIENRIPQYKQNVNYSSKKQVRFDTPSKRQFQVDVQTPRPPPLSSIENIYSPNNEQPYLHHEDMIRRDRFTRAFDNSPLKPNQNLELSVYDSPSAVPSKTMFSHNKPVPFNDLRSCSPVVPSYVSPAQRNSFKSYTPTMPVKKYTEPNFESQKSPGTLGFFTKPNSTSNVFEKYGNTPKRTKPQISKDQDFERSLSPKVFHENIHTSHMQHEKVNFKNASNDNVACNCGANRKPEVLIDHNRTYIQQNVASTNRCNGMEEKRKALISREQSNRSNIQNDNCNTLDAVSNGQLPTINDLYTLIKMQTEQMHYLQERVNDLSKKIDNKHVTDYNRPIQNSIKYSENEQYTIQQKVNTAGKYCEPPDGDMKKISVGVMTSFEVTVSSNSIKLNECNLKNIDESVQTSINIFQKKSSSTQVNEKFAQCFNGIQTINILDGIDRCDKNIENINDYANRNTNMYPKINEAVSLPKSNDQFQAKTPFPISKNTQECQTTEDDHSQYQLGWTFFNDNMKNINNILLTPPDKFQDGTQNDYRKKMLLTDLHPKSFNMMDINASSSKRVTFHINKEQPVIKPNEFSKPVSETSLHVDKLAAKYFGDNTPRLESKQRCENNVLTTNPQIHINDIENDMSLSKIQHMQKFNLLPGSRNIDKMESYPKVFEINKNKEFRQFQNYPEPIMHNKVLDITALKQIQNYPEPYNKVLDITTLKQQPKLL